VKELGAVIERQDEVGLDALRQVQALRSGEPAPAAPIETLASFVVIESQ
jgi:hypothetical protein